MWATERAVDWGREGVIARHFCAGWVRTGTNNLQIGKAVILREKLYRRGCDRIAMREVMIEGVAAYQYVLWVGGFEQDEAIRLQYATALAYQRKQHLKG